jgi:hypothetical protein
MNSLMIKASFVMPAQAGIQVKLGVQNAGFPFFTGMTISPRIHRFDN